MPNDNYTPNTLIGAIGGAVGDLFTQQGNAAEANSYTGAAQLDVQNAQLTAASTRIQETQVAREVTQSLGTTQADVAGAGFTNSGSAIDLMKMGAQQGALAKSLVNIQGAINENAYAAEAGSNFAKAKAANEANTAGTIQAIASVGGALIDNTGKLASAGKTVSQGVDYVYNSIFGSSAADAASPEELTALNEFGDVGGDLAMSATDSAIADTVAVDTSAPSILGASVDAVTTGVGDFLAGTAADVAAGATAVAADVGAVAAGVGDAVASAGSYLADAAMAALAC